MTEFNACTLRDPSSTLTATFVPNAGMIGTSLSDDGA
ncbi:MAG TPA: aldose 1-epimerase, partial [Mycobacterium sp.]|nr:aldose 1-epimerase [Mycobacterium sp.]